MQNDSWTSIRYGRSQHHFKNPAGAGRTCYLFQDRRLVEMKPTQKLLTYLNLRKPRMQLICATATAGSQLLGFLNMKSQKYNSFEKMKVISSEPVAPRTKGLRSRGVAGVSVPARIRHEVILNPDKYRLSFPDLTFVQRGHPLHVFMLYLSPRKHLCSCPCRFCALVWVRLFSWIFFCVFFGPFMRGGIGVVPVIGCRCISVHAIARSLSLFSLSVSLSLSLSLSLYSLSLSLSLAILSLSLPLCVCVCVSVCVCVCVC